MSEAKFTPGPWRWQGEDYRGDWGWQMLVGPNGEGLIVGQDDDGEPCSELRAFMPIDPSLCVTGMDSVGKRRVNAVHVFGEANARLIASAPELLEALERCIEELQEIEEVANAPSMAATYAIEVLKSATGSGTKS